jgi:4'-phosphopantetheinyl transferase
MPLHQKISINENTRILVWRITESYAELFQQVRLREVCLIRLNGMLSEIHRRGFLSIRKLLELEGYSDFDLFYDENGKPHLLDEKHISITHSGEYSAIVISDENAGIDIESRREKIIRIADKFIGSEFSYLDAGAEDFISKLTVIWGVKESIYKMSNSKELSFKDNIDVQAFEMSDRQGEARLRFQGREADFDFFFYEIDEFVLVYALKS